MSAGPGRRYHLLSLLEGEGFSAEPGDAGSESCKRLLDLDCLHVRVPWRMLRVFLGRYGNVSSLIPAQSCTNRHGRRHTGLPTSNLACFPARLHWASRFAIHANGAVDYRGTSKVAYQGEKVYCLANIVYQVLCSFYLLRDPLILNLTFFLSWPHHCYTVKDAMHCSSTRYSLHRIPTT